MHQSSLGPIIGHASPNELAAAVESFTRRFTSAHIPGQILTQEGIRTIAAGTLWQITLTEVGKSEFLSTILVIDYNAGNNIAITTAIQERESRDDAPTDVPITIVESGRPATALIHRARTIDVSQRDLVAVGHAQQSEVGAAVSRLISAIDPHT